MAPRISAPKEQDTSCCSFLKQNTLQNRIRRTRSTPIPAQLHSFPKAVPNSSSHLIQHCFHFRTIQPLNNCKLLLQDKSMLPSYPTTFACYHHRALGSTCACLLLLTLCSTYRQPGIKAKLPRELTITVTYFKTIKNSAEKYQRQSKLNS